MHGPLDSYIICTLLRPLIRLVVRTQNTSESSSDSYVLFNLSLKTNSFT